ncbi:MAG: hypothetical protein IT497_05285, partial [Ottowia sp.]|nr:hypothetical protein [Ottowia sp.]
SFIDPHSGLSAYLVVNDSAREIKVIFGGTTSGEKVAIDYSVSRLYLNKPSMFNQCVANLKAGLGRIPLCYQQGACITRAVLQQVQAENSRYAGYTVSTLGHSLGGGIAVYAALAQAQPVQAIGFSSAHLSLGIVNRLPKENVANAKNLITHFHVKNDVVPNLRYLYPGLAPVGVEAVFPSSPEVSGVGHIHAQFYEHIKRYSH